MTADEKFSNAMRAARSRLITLGVVFVGIVAVALIWMWIESGHESTDDAQVDAHITQIAAQVPGTVITVAVQDNQRVKAGDVHIKLDPRGYQAAVERARADLADAEAASLAARTGVPIASTTTSSGVSTAEAGMEVARATVTAAGTEVDAAHARLAAAEARQRAQQAEAVRARRDFDRLGELVKKEEVSQQQYDAARTAAEAAEASAAAGAAEARAAAAAVKVAESHLAQAKGAQAHAQADLASAHTAPDQMKVTRAQAEAAAARVERAKAMLKQAQLDLEHATVVAPADGIVSRRSIEVGQVVQAGQALVALVQIGDVWITANFKETQLDGMEPGQRAVVSVDAYGGRTFQGHVDSISPATGARFSLLPPENATGNYVKVVQRVPVKIVLDAGQDPDQLLRPGMSVVPTVYVR
jgi:membrane fusion protein (multidrug efflux system)